MMLDIPNHPNCAIFGIFDGHGGSYIANLVAQELPAAITKLPNMFDEEGNCISFFGKWINMRYCSSQASLH